MLLAHKYKLIAAGIVLYLVLLIANLPAVQVIHRLPLPSNIYLSGISGTLWQGAAQTVIAEGIQVNNVRWDISVLALILGKASVNITGGSANNPDEISFSGQAEFSAISQQVTLQNTLLQVPAFTVMSQLRLPLPVQAGGRFRVNIQAFDFNLSTQQCQTAQGVGNWLDATVVDRGNTIDFGQYEAKLACVDQNLQFSVVPNNLLNLDAVATLQSNGKIAVSARFKPSAQLPDSVHNAAQMFGRKDSQGFISVQM